MNLAPIGILGGTFDPIHNGHLRLAIEAFEQCGLSAVHFIPGGTPPHRSAPCASATDRLHMVQLAVHNNPAFLADGRETYRADACYTVDTLTELRAELGSQQPLCLLLGSDAFAQLHTWHEWKKLFGLAHIVVMQRPGQPLGNTMAQADPELLREYTARMAPATKVLHESPAGHIVVLNIPALEISATDIRRRCAEGKNIHALVPDAVAHFLHHHPYSSC
ncbi:MAG: nicotinate-nucleotide adenylyltransferase [Gallionellaceae bacterium]|nr:MAG: nicotinate-nucleotide adenylyltransferase [Gallionellaceae bacterium]